MGSHPDDQDHHGVHQEHYRRHHEDQHGAVDKQVRFGQVLIGFIEPLLFMLLCIKRADDHQTCEDFTGHQV